MVYDEKRRSAMHMIDDKGDTTRSRSLIDFEPKREIGRLRKAASASCEHRCGLPKGLTSGGPLERTAEWPTQDFEVIKSSVTRFKETNNRLNWQGVRLSSMSSQTKRNADQSIRLLV